MMLWKAWLPLVILSVHFPGCLSGCPVMLLRNCPACAVITAKLCGSVALTAMSLVRRPMTRNGGSILLYSRRSDASDSADIDVSAFPLFDLSSIGSTVETAIFALSISRFTRLRPKPRAFILPIIIGSASVPEQLLRFHRECCHSQFAFLYRSFLKRNQVALITLRCSFKSQQLHAFSCRCCQLLLPSDHSKLSRWAGFGNQIRATYPHGLAVNSGQDCG